MGLPGWETALTAGIGQAAEGALVLVGREGLLGIVHPGVSVAVTAVAHRAL